MKDLEIHLNAPEGASPEELSGYLDEACGDDADLRQRVEALFAADARAHSGFLDEAAPNLMTTMDSDPPGPLSEEGKGAVIGRYKLLEKLGEGGFGSVWAAEQRQPVRRRVALKVVKLGMDTKQVVARFEAERQALALMDHPNIAKILDAGATQAGRPFFAMELVKGVPNTDYCRDEKLNTQSRLKLFVDVCRAVQHAHQKGLIHRDIKPSNIMVTLHDGKPVPKVIDFGIAKATQQDLTDKTIYTQYHQFIGTPAYMSPEQAEMSGLDIDTRSDIYSLGVLLYELLTGGTPFDSKELMASGAEQMRKIIRERDPVKPSTRLSQTLQDDPTLRDRFSPDFSFSSDLDWIVMRCLEKDRSRRYDTANGLAMDVCRHLENEPVVARPPSWSYRFEKAYRRNKLLVGSLVVGTALLLIGIAGISRAWQRESVARQDADNSRTQSEINEKIAKTAQKIAEDNALVSKKAVYASDVNLASLAFRQNDLGKARRILEPYVQDDEMRGQLGWEWRFLWSAVNKSSELKSIVPHDAPVRAVSFLGDGSRVVTGGLDGTVKIWDLGTGEIEILYEKEWGDIRTFAASSDGRYVAVVIDDYTIDAEVFSSIRIIDVAGRDVLATFPGVGSRNQRRNIAFVPGQSKLVYKKHMLMEWYMIG
jgi:serine/threonine protein kinase